MSEIKDALEKVDEKVVNDNLEVNKDEPEKTFTQKEVDAMIVKRVARVKSEKPGDYEDLLAMASDLEEYGFVGTVAEKRVALKAAKEKIAADKELEEIENEAAKSGDSPEVLKKLKDAEKRANKAELKLKKVNDVEEIKKQKLEAQTKDDEEWDQQLEDFNTAHEDIDPDELAKDEKFIKFARNHKGELTAMYDDYLALMEEASQDMAEKFKKSHSRSTGGGTNVPNSGSTKLDTNQQKTLEDWNKRYPHMKMTPKEFLK